ncbi:MAG: hypothetical protein AB7T59_16390 [Hyphomonadaceae bacterium]
MTRIELAIKALEDLPADRREEIVDFILNLVAAETQGITLTDEQAVEVRKRQARGFRAGDASRIDQLIERLK